MLTMIFTVGAVAWAVRHASRADEVGNVAAAGPASGALLGKTSLGCDIHDGGGPSPEEDIVSRNVCTERHMLALSCNLKIDDIYLPREISLPAPPVAAAEIGNWSAKFQVAGGGEAVDGFNLKDHTDTLICPVGGVSKVLTGADSTLLYALASTESEALIARIWPPTSAKPVTEAPTSTPRAAATESAAPGPANQTCSAAPKEVVGGEQAARCLYQAWTNEDRPLAGVYASIPAADYLFGLTPDLTWQWQGCGEIASSPGEYACQWFAPTDVKDVGTTFLMVLGGSPALGNTVMRIEASD
ncbi:MAG: hypothetical protein HHJ11_07200 [Phycicoccus sp.]|nr:hypothetical protein [Phycicoccus sp.]